MKHKCAGKIVVLSILLALAFSAAGIDPARAIGVLFVKTGGSGDCSSWENACQLQTALATAIPGNEIWVAAGTYKPTSGTDRTAAFQLVSGISVYGGFAGTEATRGERNTSTNLTILSGDIGTIGNTSDNSYHVVTGASGSTLDGFTITAGNASNYSQSGTEGNGGAIFNNSITLTVNNLIITNNTGVLGPGIYNSGTLVVTNSTFSGNVSTSGHGGGIYNTGTLTVISSTFTGNSGFFGGGIMNNPASAGTCASPSAATIINSTFSGNSAGSGGSGVYNNYGIMTLLFNTITANLAGGVFSRNDGGTCVKAGSNIIVNNTNYDVRSGDTITRYYSLDHNLVGVAGYLVDFSLEFNLPDDQVNVTNALLGSLADNGGPTRTYALLPGSPAIDAGDDAACAVSPVDALDQRGLTRPQGLHCDSGAYEVEYFTLTYTAGTHGSISGISPQQVSLGASGTEVTAVADTGYHFVDWSDGVLTASRTDTSVTGDIDVTANFAINTYTLTYTAGEHGSISGTSPQTVDHAASGTEVTALADPGYHFVDWSDAVLTASRTDTNVTGDINVTANFALDNQSPTDITLSIMSVNENQPVGTTLGTLTTTDPDAGDTFTYSLACTVPGVDDASFLIGGVSGDELQTASVFNYETKNTYAVCIRTDDGNGGTFDKDFTITVTDVIETITATFRSIGAHDGHILESGGNTTTGGTLDSASTTFYLGDGAVDKQYRAILSFNTTLLPENAVITRVLLKIRKQSVVGSDPFSLLGGLKVDIRKPYFGTGLALALADFNAAAGRSNAATFRITPVNNWYTAVIVATGYPFINLAGTTQFRLRFLTDDNNDNAADYMKFFSGNYANAAARPTLVITYYVP